MISPETWQAIVSGERRGVSAFAWRRALYLAAIPYALGVRARNKFFDWGWKSQYRAAIPVIGVGNLSLGGTGKTPCVEYVADFYRRHEYRVAILSRGYRGEHNEAGHNDEAMLLEENLPDVPHLQGRDRSALAATAVEELESEVLVLDDGFQHRRLARDLDIVLVDATNPWGFGYLFPRGALREPVSGLRRAGVVMITRADRASSELLESIRARIRRYASVPIVLTRHQPRDLIAANGCCPVEELGGKTVAAFAGIGNPEAFRRTLEELGANLIDFRTFADHHGYTKSDVGDLRRWAARQPADAIIATTQKDFVKLRLPELGDRPLRAVRIGIGFLEGQDEFDDVLLWAVASRNIAN